jgi:hypothetical protein
MEEAAGVLSRLLDYLEPRIDRAHALRVGIRHRAALSYEPVDRLPLVCYLPYEGQDFSPYPYPEAFVDPAKMMVNELLVGFTSIYHAVDLRDDSPYWASRRSIMRWTCGMTRPIACDPTWA